MVLLLIPTSAGAQTPVRWGVKLGVTSASQTRSNDGFTYIYPSRVGLSAGIFAEWLDHPWLGVSFELSYNQKGHTLDIPFTTDQFPNGTGEFTRESIGFNYFSVAVLPKARLSLGPVELYVLAGPRMDVAISHLVAVEGKEPVRTIWAAGWESSLKNSGDVQVGGDFAVGCITATLTSVYLGAEVRYSPDFTPCAQLQGYTTTNRSWEFLLFVAI
jgi:hypothetical protein